MLIALALALFLPFSSARGEEGGDQAAPGGAKASPAQSDPSPSKQDPTLDALLRARNAVAHPDSLLPDRIKSDPSAGPDSGALDTLSKILGDGSPWRALIDPAWKAVDPDSGKAFSQSAQDAMRDKDYDQAYDDARQAIANGANDDGTYTTLAQAANQLGDYPAAAQAAQEALAINPDNQAANAVYQLSKDRSPTITLNRQPARANSGDQGDTLTGGGAAEEDPGGFMAALGAGAGAAPDPAAQQAIANRAGNVSMASAIRSADLAKDAVKALRQRDYPAARSSASEAVDANPGNFQALNLRAIADNKLGRYADAVTDASRSLKIAPSYSPARESRSWAFSKQKNYKEGLADADSVLEKEGKNPYAYQNRAFALAGLGDLEGTRAALKRSAEIDPRFKPRYEAAMKAAQPAEALALFDAAAARSASSPGSKRKMALGVIAASLTGGALAAFAMLHVFAGERKS